ncbi:MAG TPA: hypothetical protein PLH43_06690 [Acetivibrio sp.]|uniref:hypothetical protein n=1 Tax=Acetivibrio sp. TaxID=1872092 RepID=UPI002CB6651C|nr:hypothetical protein [Acetivibrio sp.]HOM02499.1 hypothetical protein [Acetivibrio sp.]
MYISKNIDILKNVDVMLLGVGYINYIDDVFTNFKRDVIPLIEHYQPKQIIFTHLEESDGMSYDEYCLPEKQYGHLNIVFSYDGMEIEI